MTATEREYEELVQRMAEELNDDDVDALDDILAPDYVIHRVGASEGEAELDREEYKQLLAEHREGDNHATQIVKEVYVDTDRNHVRDQTELTVRSEDPGDYLLSMNRLHRVEDGRIAETWEISVPTDAPDE